MCRISMRRPGSAFTSWPGRIFSGPRGAAKVGRRVYTYPPGSRIEFFDDRRLALVLVPHRGYATPWTLHIVHEGGELFGVPAQVILRVERELFGII